jgi:hypothetical protein
MYMSDVQSRDVRRSRRPGNTDGDERQEGDLTRNGQASKRGRSSIPQRRYLGDTLRETQLLSNRTHVGTVGRRRYM